MKNVAVVIRDGVASSAACWRVATGGAATGAAGDRGDDGSRSEAATCSGAVFFCETSIPAVAVVVVVVVVVMAMMPAALIVGNQPEEIPGPKPPLAVGE